MMSDDSESAPNDGTMTPPSSTQDIPSKNASESSGDAPDSHGEISQDTGPYDPVSHQAPESEGELCPSCPRPLSPPPDHTNFHWKPVFDIIVPPPKTYQDSSPYNPEVYNCTGYGDEPYEYFDGAPGKDDRFTIDLEGGSTDHLRDVRPYLYHTGFWCQKHTLEQPDIEKAPTASEVEEGYVKAGREYLLGERDKGHGYFLAKRDWELYNTDLSTPFPFQYFARCEPEEGDVGFEMWHEREERLNDFCGGLMKTNVRTALPKRKMIITAPDEPSWDRFIQWIYSPSVHGAVQMVDPGMSSWEFEKVRMMEAMTRGKWYKKEECTKRIWPGFAGKAGTL